MQLERDQVWLSWHDSTRSRGLAARLGAQLEVYCRFRSGVLRHLFGTLWTGDRLLRIRPRVIYLQNSFLLLLVCAVYKSLWWARHTRIIVDCHNKSLKRILRGPLAALFWSLKRWSFARVDLVIVSNPMLVPLARHLCPSVVCLRDPLPDWPKADPEILQSNLIEGLQSPYALFVCSFEADEPSDLVFKTAGTLPDQLGLHVVITGDSRMADIPRAIRTDPRIRVPGFVPAETYQALLVRAEVVVELTNDQDCLMCGAYEAVGAARPLVLSDTALLRDYFGQYAQLSVHEPSALTKAIREARQRSREELVSARQEFSRRFDQEWETFVEMVERRAKR